MTRRERSSAKSAVCRVRGLDLKKGLESCSALLRYRNRMHDQAADYSLISRVLCTELKMDVIVVEDDTTTWRLTDLLGRSMGIIIQETNGFLIRPAGEAVKTMGAVDRGLPRRSASGAMRTMINVRI